MLKPLWALAGVALLGTAGVVGALVVASTGGEEEVVFQEPTRQPTPQEQTAAPAATTAPAAAIPPCPPETPDEHPAFSEHPFTKTYEDLSAGYSLLYPDNWTICLPPFNPQTRDLVSGIDFLDENELRRASVRQFSNPGGLPLDDWIVDHDPIFFDQPPEERTIAGEPALFSYASLGLPSGDGYVARRGVVFELSGLLPKDFDLLATAFRFMD